MATAGKFVASAPRQSLDLKAQTFKLPGELLLSRSVCAPPLPLPCPQPKSESISRGWAGELEAESSLTTLP